MPQPKNDVNKKPVGGYAAGDYNCTCCKCGDLFAGDKRAVTCAACAYGLHIEKLESTLERINDWCNAYPVEIFKEPDFKKAAKVLKENGMTIDSISASAMRHVLKGIKQIITDPNK